MLFDFPNENIEICLYAKEKDLNWSFNDAHFQLAIVQKAPKQQNCYHE
jgi:hypothetical protein